MCHGLSQIVQADLQISSNASLFSAERRPAIGAPDEMQSTVLASTRLASGIPMWADEQIAADPKSRRTDRCCYWSRLSNDAARRRAAMPVIALIPGRRHRPPDAEMPASNLGTSPD
jgi:hypothetical protein